MRQEEGKKEEYGLTELGHEQATAAGYIALHTLTQAHASCVQQSVGLCPPCTNLLAATETVYVNAEPNGEKVWAICHHQTWWCALHHSPEQGRQQLMQLQR